MIYQRKYENNIPPLIINCSNAVINERPKSDEIFNILIDKIDKIDNRLFLLSMNVHH